jgi:HEPN domain-containing protein
VHDLIILSRLAKIPKELLNKIREFSGIYTETRYGITGIGIPATKFKIKDTLELLNISKEVLKWTKKI